MTDGAPTYLTHPDPANRSESNYILQVRVPGEINTFEQLWVRKMPENRFRVCCIPFFLYDISVGDVIEWNDSDRIVRVVESSGRYVFRVWFAEDSVDQGSVVEFLMSAGAVVERSSRRLVAVDAPDETSATAVADWLFQQQEQGMLIYETGHS